MNASMTGGLINYPALSQLLGGLLFPPQVAFYTCCSYNTISPCRGPPVHRLFLTRFCGSTGNFGESFSDAAGVKNERHGFVTSEKAFTVQ